MPHTFTLTAAQRQEFDRVGVLRLPGSYAADAVAPMAAALWADLKRRYGVEPERSETWTVERPFHFQALERSGAFEPLNSAGFRALADDLLGEGAWEVPRRWGQPLVTFPTGAWDVPHAAWHLDFIASAKSADIAVMRAFVFLEPVRPRGGGTVYIEGSHKAVIDCARSCGPDERMRSAEVREALAREEPWLADLLSAKAGDRVRRFMVEGGALRGHPVRVAEMTGEPGDLMLMHPAMLHTSAGNALDRPRMMLTQWVFRRGATEEAYGPVRTRS